MTPYRFECYLGALDLSNCIDYIQYDLPSLSLELTLNENAMPLGENLRYLRAMRMTEHYSRFYMCIPHGFSVLRVYRKAELQNFWASDDEMILRVDLSRLGGRDLDSHDPDDLAKLKELIWPNPLPISQEHLWRK